MTREIHNAFTIDGPHALELDDAIAIETTSTGFVVHVSIADVSHWVEHGTSLDVQARERAFTRYLASGASEPMFPRVLSEVEASLLMGELRPAVTVSIPVDGAFRAGPPRIRRTLVRNTSRLTYEQADAAADQADHPLQADLQMCQRVARGLLEARSAAGALALFDLDRGLMMGEDGRLRPIEQGGRHHACMVIQEFMILANASVARVLAERGLPALYRNHKALPTAPSRDALLADLRHCALDPRHFPIATLDEKLSLVLGRAFCGPRVEGHYALNLPVYVHFTSPLRRYADLVNHRILLAAVEGGPSPYDLEELERVAAYLNDVEDDVRQARRSALREAALREADEAATPRALVRNVEVGLAGSTDAPVSPVTPEREQMLLDRLRRGEVEAADLYRLLFARWRVGAAASQPMLEASLAVLREHPERAVSVLQMAHQQLGWPLPETTDAREGPPHAPTFVARATWATPDREIVGIARDRTKKSSVQGVSVGLLEALLGMVPVAPRSTSPEMAVLAEPAHSHALPDVGNAKGRLLELCQARKWPRPTFAVTRSGTPHAPVFTVVAEVIVDGHLRCSEPCAAPGQRRGEQMAAHALLESLSGDLTVSLRHSGQSVERNPIGWLQEACQGLGLPLPRYVDRPVDSGFEVTCTVTLDDGRVIETHASAPRKAEARRAAAAAAAARWTVARAHA